MATIDDLLDRKATLAHGNPPAQQGQFAEKLAFPLTRDC